MDCQKKCCQQYKNEQSKSSKEKKILTAQFVEKKQTIKKIRRVTIVNKTATQRSLCTVYTSRKPKFLKQKPKYHR